MKPNILTKTIAALLLALPLARADENKENRKDEKKTEEKKDGQKSGTTSSSSIVTSADGTATVTIDINGKKETRTFKLGDGDKVFNFEKSFSFGNDPGAKVGVGIGEDARIDWPKGAKHEKGPWIGIAMEPVQDVVRAQLSLAPGEGIVVSHVAPDSPAAKAGLQANDILLRFDDQILVEPAQLKKLIAMKKAGDSVKLTYLRKGERKDASVTLVEHELEVAEHHPMQWLQMPGAGGFKGGGGDFAERLQEQLKQLKEKHPGVIVDKQMWFSGAPGEMLKKQIEKLERGLDEAKLPKEELEKLRNELDKAKRTAEKAMERAKRSGEEAVEHARRAVDEASRAINSARKPFEKEKGERGEKEKFEKPQKEKGDQPKKSEPL